MTEAHKALLLRVVDLTTCPLSANDVLIAADLVRVGYLRAYDSIDEGCFLSATSSGVNVVKAYKS